ncbi:MAG: hypothetical protein AB8U08_00180 [Rickettsia aeschlimannii]
MRSIDVAISEIITNTEISSSIAMQFPRNDEKLKQIIEKINGI